MRVAFRHFLLDRESTLYRLPSAALDRMLHNPTGHRLALFAGQRVRSAEVVLEMMNARPLAVLRSVFNMLTFKSDGTLVSPLRDRHVRARAELALALDSPPARALLTPAPDSSREVANGSHPLPSCGALSKPPSGA